MSDSQSTCTCRVLQDRDGNPYIADRGCSLHGGPQPEFSVMLYGQRYDFYRTSEFAKLVGRSVSNLNKDTRNPARMKDRGRVLWCMALYAENLFPKGHEFKSPGGVPITGRKLTVKDFEQKIIEAKGGRA